MSSNQQILMEAFAKQYFHVNIGLRFLPYMLGGFFDQLLLGVVIAQTISYARFLKTDPWHVVTTTTASVLCSFAASICILVWMTRLFVWGFGSYLPFFKTEFVVKYIYIDVITILLVQSLYAHRACRLYKHWWPIIILGPLSLGTLAFGLATAIHIQRTYAYFSPDSFKDYLMNVVAYGWMAFAVITDLALTTIIILGLYRYQTGWDHTNRRIRRIMIHCFEAQVPALLVATCTIALWSRVLELSLFMILLHTKVYVLGLLITLNFRTTDKSAVYVSRQYASAQKMDDDVALV